MLIQSHTRRLPFADSSIDHIYTDPPYLKKHLDCYLWLASEAARVLRPGGFLMAMLGGSYKNQVFRYFDDAGLDYFWDYSFLMGGSKTGIVWKNHPTDNPAGNKPIVVRTKSILIYSKGRALPRTGTQDLIDVLDSGENWKQFHVWGQSVGVARYYLDCFTHEGQLICDPFIGGGSTALACRIINRRFVGCDLDRSALLASQNNLDGQVLPMPDGSMFAGVRINGYKEPLFDLIEMTRAGVPRRAGFFPQGDVPVSEE